MDTMTKIRIKTHMDFYIYEYILYIGIYFIHRIWINKNKKRIKRMKQKRNCPDQPVNKVQCRETFYFIWISCHTRVWCVRCVFRQYNTFTCNVMYVNIITACICIACPLNLCMCSVYLLLVYTFNVSLPYS